MPNIYFENKQYPLLENETVLDCLLRNGVVYPHSCKIGTCQTCLCTADPQSVNPEWQKGLKATLVGQGCFLPCISRPVNDMAIARPNLDNVSFPAKINALYHLNYNVICVRLSVENLKEWTPGRYLNLINLNNDIRSYSIANIPENDGYIELHVKVISTGLMGNWLLNHARVGMTVNIRGPIGDCYYYNPNHESFPMILAGTGTGLAPLHGIALDALQQNHQGKIILIHGGVKSDDLYFDSRLIELSKKHDNFFYKKSILENNSDGQLESIDKLMLALLSECHNPAVYICGPPETTKLLKNKAFLSGVSSKKIHSDSFSYS